MYRNNILNREVKDFPTRDSVVITKNKKEYTIVKRKISRTVITAKVHINVLIYEAVHNEEEKAYFGFVLVPNRNKTKTEGIFVSNQINKNTLFVNENFFVSYYKEMGLGRYIKSEENLLNKVEIALKRNYGYEKVIRFPNPKDYRFLRFSFGNYQTKAKFNEMYKKLKYREYLQNSSYIRSDFVAKKKNKYIIIETENTYHNKQDFFWKLFKLEKTKKNVLFVFKKNNVVYHLELLSMFQRMIGKKCNKFLFITIEELEAGKDFKYVVDWIV